MRQAARVAALVFLALLLAASDRERFKGEVVGVVDGDTIDVMRDGKAERVRLNGIDCPERRQAFGTRAKERVSELAGRKVVTVEVTGYDRWDRALGDVTLPDGRSLNRELVRDGLAWWFRRYSKDQDLAALEEEARAGKRGLWSDPDPLPPRDFRSKGRR